MKKLSLFFMFFVSVFLVVSCNKPSSPTEFMVRFYEGETLLKEEKVEKDGKATRYLPTKDGYDFVDWYKEKELTNVFDFNEKIVADTSIYAKFKEKEEIKVEYIVKLNDDKASFSYGMSDNLTTVNIDKSHIYLDGRLSDEDILNVPNVYNNFNAALEAVENGTEENPASIYIAPYVYWIHDPKAESTTEPYGIVKEVEYLELLGLGKKREHVVIAANFGHDEGYQGGNWTMFKFTGDGLRLDNLTFGNYCNIDLEYELDPSLNVKKRTTNITQGQIAEYHGDKLYATNVNFVSRLNMMPFNNTERALYVDCHFESTDDALNGSKNSVYLNSDFEFYASKPWYSSEGSTLLNCDIEIKRDNLIAGSVIKQYLSKAPSDFTLVDVRFNSSYNEEVIIGFNDVLSKTHRSNYANVTYNGKKISMENGVDISDKSALEAFKVTKDGNTIYNIYNLLKGDDNWDPLKQKEVIESLGVENKATYAAMYAETEAGKLDNVTIESGNSVNLVFNLLDINKNLFALTEDISWSVESGKENYIKLSLNNDKSVCTVSGVNETEDEVSVFISAKSESGFEALVEVVVKPSILEAPKFSSEAVIVQEENGNAKVNYELNLNGRADQSEIKWFVSDDELGTNAIEIAVSRNDEPLKEINLSKAYVGKYLIVNIRPKHKRSDYGAMHKACSNDVVTEVGIKDVNKLDVDLLHFSTATQEKVLPGLWTLDSYKPLDTYEGEAWYSKNKIDPLKNWAYGVGHKNGFLNYSGIYQTGYGARLMYTPLAKEYGDMDVTLKVAPGKTASQGFGSANQYMDIMIKYDTTTLSGYGMRIYRNTGDSCGVVLMEYQNGRSKEISDKVITSAYLTEATIRVYTVGDKLNCSLTTTGLQTPTQESLGYLHEVNLSANITANIFGGFAIQHAGTAGDNSTYIGQILLNWQ